MPSSTAGPGTVSFPTAAEVLRSAEHLRLAPLVGDDKRAWLSVLAQQFAVPVRVVCLECRLRENDDRVDLALCIPPPGGERERVAAILLELTKSLGQNAHWRRTLRFLESWAAEAQGFRPEFPFVWLAFDLDAVDEALPVPCPAPCVDADFFARRRGERLPLPRPSEVAQLAAACHGLFRELPLPDSARQLVLRCLSVEDVNVQAKHFSFMLSREPATFKLDVRLPVVQVGSFLSAIGWPGPAAAIEERIRYYMPWQGHVQLNLVLSPSLTNPLEVEFLSSAEEVAPAERFAFLDRLVETALCSPQKANVLRQAWDQRLLDASEEYDTPVALNWYVKIRFEREIASEAKAYLGLMPKRWLRPGQLESRAQLES